jgi:hypothetical protein
MGWDTVVMPDGFCPAQFGENEYSFFANFFKEIFLRKLCSFYSTFAKN